MRKLRLSTTTNLVPRVEDKIYEHTMANAEMAKRVGFDALDFSFCPNVFDENRFEEYAEWGLEASERFGLKYEVCHLPFSGKVALDPSLLPALETKILNIRIQIFCSLSLWRQNKNRVMPFEGTAL